MRSARNTKNYKALEQAIRSGIVLDNRHGSGLRVVSGEFWIRQKQRGAWYISAAWGERGDRRGCILSCEHIAFFLQRGYWDWERPPAATAEPARAKVPITEIPDAKLVKVYYDVVAELDRRKIDPVRRVKIVTTEVPI